MIGGKGAVTMKLLKEFRGRHTKALILLVSVASALAAVGGG